MYKNNIPDKKKIVGLLITDIINVTLEWVSVHNILSDSAASKLYTSSSVVIITTHYY